MPLRLPPRVAVRLHRRLLCSGPQPVPLLLGVVLLAFGAVGCRPAPAPPPASTTTPAQAEAIRQKQQLAARQCQQRRRQLRTDLEELRRAEAELAEARALVAPPLKPPPVWDETAERRFSQVDQELDRQRYEQELALWQRHEADQRALIARQRQRQDGAQQRLDRQAQRLRRSHPGLFTGPSSIEVKPQELERLTRCPVVPA